MKKLIVERKWKRYLASRSRSQAEANARSRAHRRERNVSASKHTRRRQFKKQTSVDGPAVFSLIQNPEETIAFFQEMREAAERKNVFVNLSGVKTMTPDAVASLLATVHHCELGGSQVSGNVPSDPLPREMLNDSGFRNYVRSSLGYRQTLTPHGQIVRREAGGEAFYNRFDQHMANRLIQFANLNSKPQGPSFSVLCEAMLNTLNHASEEGSSHEPWWASAYLDSGRNRVCFTFIDQGVGIFRSYSLVMWWKMLAPRVFLNRGEILRRLFQGKIPSSTKVPGRGNGIPEMYEHCKAGRIRNLTVIANDGMGNAETETYQQLSNSFPGTLLYWEV